LYALFATNARIKRQSERAEWIFLKTVSGTTTTVVTQEFSFVVSGLLGC
jgi:hypothetical protein